MNPIKATSDCLDKVQHFLETFPGGSRYLPKLAAQRIKINEPCVLAVAGRVKAGKSSFINSLIGVDLAKVGELETTATINRFCYGRPDDPRHPVKVVWENGTCTYETRDFMDSLQGHDAETLRKAEGIAYLEFKVENEMLKELTLVDTPGTDAIVGADGDAHQKVTENFFHLRDKHSKQTDECTSTADAVIYLVGPVATAAGKTFLDEFRSCSGRSSALNAIGVMSKIDIDQTLLARRKEQSEYVANSLREQLNTVIPVSAGLHDAIRAYSSSFASWQQTLKQIPPKAFGYFMKQESTYLTERQEVLDALYAGTKDSGMYSDTPIGIDARRQLRGTLFWSIFRTIATTLYESADANEALAKLNDIANIAHVKDVIVQQFFNRSKFIRCYNALTDVQRLLDDIRRNGFYSLHARARQKSSIEAFIRNRAQPSDMQAVSVLNDLINENIKSEPEIERLESSFVHDVVSSLEKTLEELRQYDMDFQTLQQLQSHRNDWSEEEYHELCNIFGLYGTSFEVVDPYGREQYWRMEALTASSSVKKTIAENAAEKYSNM
jgi:GTPase Era involved in 16S rRNA processing